MKISEVVLALSAYLSGKGSFRVGARTITIANTGSGPVKFTFATALAAIEQAALLSAVTGQTYPVGIVIGSTAITVS